MPPAHSEFTHQAANALAVDIRRHIAGEVRFDDGSRALYATDASNYRQVPIGVVIPRTVEDVVETIAICRAHGAPLLARGGGTSLAGQCCNTAVIIDMSKYLRQILSLDPKRQRAIVEPGCVLDFLREAAEEHHLTFGPDPSTHDHNTLGGMIGNNSCGVHSIMAGRTVDNVHALDILTYDGLRLRVGPTPEDELEAIIRQGGRRGEIYAGLKALRDAYADQIRVRYPRIPRRVSGYNLDELLPEKGFHVARALVGTEGTCAVILQAELQLVPSPPKRSLLVLGYPDVYQAGDQVPEILEHHPIGLEGIDDLLVDYMKKINLHPQNLKLLPDGGGWLLVEFGAETKEEADAQARSLMDSLKKQGSAPTMKLFDNPGEEQLLWKVRASGLGATAHVPGQKITWEGWEDAAVPPAKVGPYLRDFRKLLEKYGYGCALYGHFGDGCIHVRIDFELSTTQGIEIYKRFTNDAADLVIGYGRIAFRRARGRPIPRRPPAENVRRGIDSSVPAVQNTLGSAGQDESRQDSRPLSPRFEPADRHRLPSPDSRYGIFISARPEQLRYRFAALRRRRRLPPSKQGRDVPELYGNARGNALDPRPGPAFV